MMKTISMSIIGALFIVTILAGCTPRPIGGQTDQYGCLSGAGYSWNESVGGCIREWELNQSQRIAAKAALMPISARPVTIARVDQVCPTCFKVYIGNSPDPINVQDGQVVQCSTCPQFSPPGPNYCSNGIIKSGGVDVCGCQQPPICETRACTEEAKICPDGSAVSRNSSNNCEFDTCPTTAAQEKKYVGTDLEQCKVIKFLCIQGSQYFTDDKGCGCEPINQTGKLKATDCTDPRPDYCTKEYNPVCGQVQIQCIRAPCNPIMQTFGNKCEACSNRLTISWMPGACANNTDGKAI
jgi:hypothetical protein